MTGRPPSSWLVPVLLALPLIVITAWIALGAVNRSHDRTPRAAAAPPSAVRPVASRAASLPGLPAAESDLAEDKLDERVDGAAEFLRALGCRRLVYWRVPDPAADLEVLVFAAADGAAKALARDAGDERTRGPGDEAQVGEQSVYFRRGRFFVRLLADPGAPADAAALARCAAGIDRALQGGGGTALAGDAR